MSTNKYITLIHRHTPQIRDQCVCVCINISHLLFGSRCECVCVHACVRSCVWVCYVSVYPFGKSGVYINVIACVCSSSSSSPACLYLCGCIHVSSSMSLSMCVCIPLCLCVSHQNHTTQDTK